ncbi:MAG: holo-[acyl-carrier-protein] synthase, partial [Gemmatimonadetes bacterium]
MIVGMGLDVVEVVKVRELLAQQTFEERVFTPAERHDCAGRADKAEALAARFAAKEACFKALGTGWSQGVSFLQVEVQRA